MGDDGDDSVVVPRVTSKLDVPLSSIIRKNAHNRSTLYSADAALQMCSIKCATALTRDAKIGSVFHKHETVTDLNASRWTRTTSIQCWHCCEAFGTPPVPIPKTFDVREQTFVVFGNFCSLQCAKGYIVETSGFDSGQQLVVFAKMARDIYNTYDVKAAPPRLSLKKFGGFLDIDTFKSGSNSVVCHKAPFVSSLMIFEEQPDEDATPSIWQNSLQGLRRPANPVRTDRGKTPGMSKYEEYIAAREKTDGDPPEPTNLDAGLARFMKNKAPHTKDT